MNRALEHEEEFVRRKVAGRGCPGGRKSVSSNMVCDPGARRSLRSVKCGCGAGLEAVDQARCGGGTQIIKCLDAKLGTHRFSFGPMILGLLTKGMTFASGL